jgi:hypothetical protein
MSDDLSDLGRQYREGEELVAFWESLDREARTPLLLAEYRCRFDNCLLLHIFRLPAGRLWHKPGYDLSPARTEAETDPAARRNRTADGYRRWRARAGPLDDLIEFVSDAPQLGGLDLDCDHIRRLFVPSDRLDADASGVPGPQRPIFWPA